MSDQAYGNTSSPAGDIGPEATPIFNESNTQEQPMTEHPSLTEQEQSDMNAISDAFSRARDAIIQASALGKQVQELVSAVAALRSEVETLRGELASARERNAMLDEHLVNARRQRDEAREEAYAVRTELAQRTAERDRAMGDLSTAQRDNTTLDDRNQALQRRCSEYETTILTQGEELDALRKKLAAIRAVFAPAQAEPHKDDNLDRPSYEQTPSSGW